jgi:hypothetical protein
MASRPVIYVAIDDGRYGVVIKGMKRTTLYFGETHKTAKGLLEQLKLPYTKCIVYSLYPQQGFRLPITDKDTTLLECAYQLLPKACKADIVMDYPVKERKRRYVRHN